MAVQHLLVGGALTGVLAGVTAQQALANLFAGLALLNRPFTVGDRIRVRSGALSGQFDGTVTEVGLTYLSMDTDSGALQVPNASVLVQLQHAASTMPGHTRRGVRGGDQMEPGNCCCTGIGAGAGGPRPGPSSSSVRCRCSTSTPTRSAQRSVSGCKPAHRRRPWAAAACRPRRRSRSASWRCDAWSCSTPWTIPVPAGWPDAPGMC